MIDPEDNGNEDGEPDYWVCEQRGELVCIPGFMGIPVDPAYPPECWRAVYGEAPDAFHPNTTLESNLIAHLEDLVRLGSDFPGELALHPSVLRARDLLQIIRRRQSTSKAEDALIYGLFDERSL